MTVLTVLIRIEGTIYRRKLEMGPNTPTIGLQLSIPSVTPATFLKAEITPNNLTWSVWRQEYIAEVTSVPQPWLAAHGFIQDQSYEAY